MTMISSLSEKKVTISSQHSELETKLESYFIDHNSILGATPLNFSDLSSWDDLIRKTYSYSFFKL